MIIGTCGHRIRGIVGNPTSVKSLTRANVPAIKDVVLCPKCRLRARRAGVILDTPKEKEAWLSSEGKGKVW